MQYDGRMPEPPYPTDADEKDARIAELEQQLAMANDAAAKGDLARANADGMEMRIRELEKALRLCHEVLSGHGLSKQELIKALEAIKSCGLMVSGSHG